MSLNLVNTIPFSVQNDGDQLMLTLPPGHYSCDSSFVVQYSVDVVAGNAILGRTDCCFNFNGNATVTIDGVSRGVYSNLAAQQLAWFQKYSRTVAERPNVLATEISFAVGAFTGSDQSVSYSPYTKQQMIELGVSTGSSETFSAVYPITHFLPGVFWPGQKSFVVQTQFCLNLRAILSSTLLGVFMTAGTDTASIGLGSQIDADSLILTLITKPGLDTIPQSLSFVRQNGYQSSTNQQFLFVPPTEAISVTQTIACLNPYNTLNIAFVDDVQIESPLVTVNIQKDGKTLVHPTSPQLSRACFSLAGNLSGINFNNFIATWSEPMIDVRGSISTSSPMDIYVAACWQVPIKN